MQLDPITAEDEPAHDPGDGLEHAEAAADPGLRRVGWWLALLAIAFTIVMILQLVVVRPYRIPSESMLPTLEDGDRVLVNRLSYVSGSIERGHVVVFDRPPLLPGEDDVIKRVVGLPGEVVRFTNDAVYIDGLRMVEPYVADGVITLKQGGIPGCDTTTNELLGCVVPEGHVFVLGDNRTDSIDSRDYGPVAIDSIIGRAAARIWPPLDVNQL